MTGEKCERFYERLNKLNCTANIWRGELYIVNTIYVMKKYWLNKMLSLDEQTLKMHLPSHQSGHVLPHDCDEAGVLRTSFQQNLFTGKNLIFLADE